MNPDFFKLAQSICHDPHREVAAELEARRAADESDRKQAAREERERFDDREPAAPFEREEATDRREELRYWRNS